MQLSCNGFCTLLSYAQLGEAVVVCWAVVIIGRSRNRAQFLETYVPGEATGSLNASKIAASPLCKIDSLAVLTSNQTPPPPPY